jgi:hypothetical protein
MIVGWMKQPVVRVHVLLDRKGKTLSHAYVELSDEDAAKAALRGAQNSVLGRGKRARGVTVTRSTQAELMRALFPSWQGNFDGQRPSLAGLTNEQMMVALTNGLVTENELNSLLHLIRSPDSHFLKVPSLPFHSLISILAKFSPDVEGRIMWPKQQTDLLYGTGPNTCLVSSKLTDYQTSRRLRFRLSYPASAIMSLQRMLKSQLNSYRPPLIAEVSRSFHWQGYGSSVALSSILSSASSAALRPHGSWPHATHSASLSHSCLYGGFPAPGTYDATADAIAVT